MSPVSRGFTGRRRPLDQSSLPPDTLLDAVETFGYHNHGDPWLEQRYQAD